MTSVFLTLLNEVFNSHAKSYSFDDFSYWLLNSGESKQFSMIFQLLFVARQNERLTAQVDRAKERTKQRKSEKETIKSSEATSAFTNTLDNRVEEFLSLVYATAPLVRDKSEAVSLYADWLVYLQNQFLALSKVDELSANGRESVTLSGTLTADDESFLKLLLIEDNERAHMFSADEHTGDRVSLDQIRSLLLFRIQNCLLSRSVFGTFVDHVPFQTDHSKMLSDVATGRYLATHCMHGLRSLHDAENDDGTARFSYTQLLEMMSANNSLLDEAVCLKKSGFPIQYAKKISEAFKRETHALIDEFTKYYDSLPRNEQHSFRKTVVDDKLPVVSKKVRSKRQKNDDDEDYDDKNVDDESDEEPPQKKSTALVDVPRTPHNESATMTRFPSLFASPSASLLGGDDYFARGGSVLQSPRAMQSIFREFRFEDDVVDGVKPPQPSCVNCKRLQVIIADLTRNATTNAAMLDVSAFFTDHPVHAPIFLPELEGKDERATHEEEMRVANQKIAALEKELAESKQQLHESQRLQIAAQNAKTVAERNCAKMAQKLSTRNIDATALPVAPLFDAEKLHRNNILPSLFF